MHGSLLQECLIFIQNNSHHTIVTIDMDQFVDSLQQKLGISLKTVPHAAVHDYDAHVRAANDA